MYVCESHIMCGLVPPRCPSHAVVYNSTRTHLHLGGLARHNPGGSRFIAQLSTRQRNELIRRCGEPPKVGNSSLASYRRLSFWLPSALALNGGAGGSEGGAGRGQGGVASGPSVSVPPGGHAASNARDRRAAMFRSRSLKHRLAEACEVVLSSEAVRGSTTRRRERGLRRLFCAHGSGGRSPMLLSSTMNSVLLMVGIIAALWAYQRYSRS